MKIRLVTLMFLGSFFALPVAAQAVQNGGAAVLSPATVLVSGPAGEVTLAELRELIEDQMPPTKRETFWASPKLVGDALRNLYGQRALAKKAVEEGLDRQPRASIYLNQQRERALAEWLLQQRARARIGDPKVLEQFARTAYKAEPERFRHPEQVRLRHIMVIQNPDDKEGVMAKKRAESMLANISGGTPFEKMAREFSDDKNSALKGGDLGFSDVGGMIPEFEEMVAKLKPGQHSGPVRVKDAYHIIQLVERRPAGVAPFEEVEPMIRAEAQEKLNGEERRRVWQSVVNNDTVRINDAAVADLVRPSIKPINQK